MEAASFLDDLPYSKQSRAVNDAVEKALLLVKTYSECEYNEQRGPWSDPDTIYSELDQARSHITEAWDELKAVVACTNTTKPSSSLSLTATDNVSESDKEALRVAYVDMITDAFADCLEDLRVKEDVSVTVLVDCLQSGFDLIRSLDLEDTDFSWKDDKMNEDTLTPHERRRRQLGFHVEND